MVTQRDFWAYRAQKVPPGSGARGARASHRRLDHRVRILIAPPDLFSDLPTDALFDNPLSSFAIMLL